MRKEEGGEMRPLRGRILKIVKRVSTHRYLEGVCNLSQCWLAYNPLCWWVEKDRFVVVGIIKSTTCECEERGRRKQGADGHKGRRRVGGISSDAFGWYLRWSG